MQEINQYTVVRVFPEADGDDPINDDGKVTFRAKSDRGVYCLVSFSLHGEVFHVRPLPKELCCPENGHEYAYRIPLFSRNNSAAILASLHQMTDGEYFIEALWVISSSTTSTAKPAWVEQFRSRSKIYSGSRFVEVTQREILSHGEMNKFWIGVNYVESLVPV
ncbi:hypothetical protein COP1_008872 [Malus domestica]